ncbi:MAG: ATP phosphoribosyltransferase [Candidatus Gastranaerophilales bacterium]|nr:ATP phosphoribosyltransferase [Candidatus Gastranaerophilales bacterium]
MDEMLRIALPNKGRLSQKIYELLDKAGLNLGSKDERCLKLDTLDNKFQLIFVRAADIPNFLDSNVADIGFTGRDIVVEKEIKLDIIKEFNFGKCDMVVALPEELEINDATELKEKIKQPVRVATSFPNIAKSYFKKLGIEAKISEIMGAVEITPSLGFCDCVIDITSTGTTLKSNRLKIIDKILSSSTVLCSRCDLEPEKQLKLRSLIRAIDSVIDAQSKKYLMAHIPKNKIEDVKKFLPGLSSPTVMPLYESEDKVVIHVVVDEDKIYDAIDNLKQIGGGGILILSVNQMVK